MKVDEKFNNMKIALSIVGINVDYMSAEMICQINDLLNKKKSNTTIRDIKKIEANLIAKYNEIENNIQDLEMPTSGSDVDES